MESNVKIISAFIVAIDSTRVGKMGWIDIESIESIADPNDKSNVVFILTKSGREYKIRADGAKLKATLFKDLTVENVIRFDPDNGMDVWTSAHMYNEEEKSV